MTASQGNQDRVRERRKQATALRLAGVSWQQIADQLGYADRQSACTDVRRARERSQAELDISLTELRDQELDRLDRMQVALWPQAMAGDQRAAETVLKIMRRRAAYLQLDMPIVHEVITIDSIERELAQLREAYPDLTAPGDRSPLRRTDGAAGAEAG